MGSHPKPSLHQRVGILLTSDPTAPTETVQLLDTAAADLFSFMNPDILRMANYPEDVAAKGCYYEILYIAEKEHGKTVKLSNVLECTVTVRSVSLFTIYFGSRSLTAVTFFTLLDFFLAHARSSS